MVNEFILSPEELYFLGGLIQAKYIDYAYIAALEDIQQNIALRKKETISEMVKKNLVEEDFSGDLEVNQNLRHVLEPIFFGVKESSLDICYVGDEKRVDIYKFHFLEDNITMVTGKDKRLHIKNVTEDMFVELLNDILPRKYEVDDTVLDSIDHNLITRLIAVKCANINENSFVHIYIESDNKLFFEKKTGALSVVSKEDFINEAVAVLRGEKYGI